MSWLDWKNPQYLTGLPRWTFARDHYTGRVLECGADQPRRHDGGHSAVPLSQTGDRWGTISKYLIRKGTGETEDAYRERCRLADYTAHFATVVDSLAGMLFANEDDANRPFTEPTSEDQPNPFGSKDDLATPMGQLWANADGLGTGWITLWKQLTTELVVTHLHWVLVDSVEGEPRVKLIPPEAVPNWLEGPNGPIDVLVVEQADTRKTLEDDPTKGQTQRFLRYTLTGWQRYEQAASGEPVALTGPENSGSYTFEDAAGNDALPIYRIELPMARPVGWMLARKANAIFNKESERDHLLRVANFPKLNLDATDDTAYDRIAQQIASGANVLQGKDHNYIAPDTGPATVATEVLVRKVEEFYVTAFREYGDAAKERTATEVRQDVSSGVGAFLQMLKAALEDAENCALWRIAQILWPQIPANWWTARVERSDDFLPGDINATIERTRTWFFGKDQPIPLGRQAKLAAAKQVADYTGIQVEDRDVEAAIDLQTITTSLLTLEGLPVPATAKAMLVIKLLDALDITDPEAEVEMGDGQKKKLRDVLLAEALQLAGAADELQRQQAETFRNPGASPTDPNAPPDAGAPPLAATGTDGPHAPGGVQGPMSVTINPTGLQSLRIERDTAGRILRLIKE